MIEPAIAPFYAELIETCDVSRWVVWTAGKESAMCPAFDRGESGSVPRGEIPAAASNEPADDPAVGSHMLDQILELTSGGEPRAGFVEAADVAAMREVANALAGQPFSLEPVVVELIHAVLELQFHKAGIPSATVRQMARHVATTLYDDPQARERLEILWSRLSAK